MWALVSFSKVSRTRHPEARVQGYDQQLKPTPSEAFRVAPAIPKYHAPAVPLMGGITQENYSVTLHPERTATDHVVDVMS